MTTMHELQLFLRDTGRYPHEVDGWYGPKTKAAIELALTDGPDTALTEADYRASAGRLGVKLCSILAVAEVEAMGAGFFAGKPKILPEPHRFAKLTKARFNKSHPHLSYNVWGTRPYPKTQAERYEQLHAMVALDIDAGFDAASYGKFQILGENHAACGYDSSWKFAFAMAVDEQTQLKAFEQFLRSTGILPALMGDHWAEFARRYNGPAYRKNRYDVKLATASRNHARRLGII